MNNLPNDSLPQLPDDPDQVNGQPSTLWTWLATLVRKLTEWRGQEVLATNALIATQPAAGVAGAVGNPLVATAAGSAWQADVAFSTGVMNVTGNPYEIQINGVDVIQLNTGGTVSLFSTLFAATINFATFVLSGGQFFTPITKTSTGSLNNSQGVILINAVGGAITLTLPPALTFATRGQQLQLIRIDGSANVVTIQRAGSDFIDESITNFIMPKMPAVPTSIPDGHAVRLQADGVSMWFRC